MAVPRDLLIDLSLSSKEQLTKLRSLARFDSTLINAGRLEMAVRLAVDDRLQFARDFLSFARDLASQVKQTDDMYARNALGRTYYAAHHGIRAALLELQDGDEYDHREAIKAFHQLLLDNNFLREKLKSLHGSNTTPDRTRQALVDLLEMRHDADYHGYGSSKPGRQSLDFMSESQQAMKWVAELLEKIETYIEDRRNGKVK